MYYVYLLRCADDTLYTGITTDPVRRLQEHRGGKRGAKYTASHKALAFEQIWQTDTRALASRLEYRLKTLTHTQKERLIADPSQLDALLGTVLDSAAYQPLSTNQ